MAKDKIYKQHILDSIAWVEKYTAEKGLSDLENDRMLQNEVIREIEIIGEAVKRLSASFKDPIDQPWRSISGMRDKLIHDYFGVDLNAVWNVVKKDLPELKAALLANGNE